MHCNFAFWFGQCKHECDALDKIGMDMQYDLIVIGGGVIGTAVAAYASQQHRVLLLEQYQPTHGRGSSHGDGRVVRTSYPEPIYVEMAQRAMTQWHALERITKRTLIHQTGEWNIGTADSPQLPELADNLDALQLPYERLTPRQSERRFPHFHVHPKSELLFVPSSGVIRADTAVSTLWQVAQERGATLLENQHVTAVETNTQQATVHTTNATYTGHHLIITAGGWANQLLHSFDVALPLDVTQEQLSYFPNDNPAIDHTYRHMPVFIDYTDPLRTFYGLPQIDTAGVKVGWHHGGKPIQPDEKRVFDETNDTAVRQFVRQRLPHLHPTPTTKLTCLYTNTPDYHFILDTLPHQPRLTIGAGFSGHGFKFAPIIGQLLTEIALGRPTAVNVQSFAHGRFTRPLTRRTGA